MDVTPPLAIPPTAQLLLVRHVRTDMAGRFCGHADPAISAAGERQLASLCRSLREYRITQVFSSDLRRARQTAEAIAGGAVPVELVPELREISFGQWEGLSWDEIVARDRDYASRWVDAYPRLGAPEGEDFAAFTARVSRAFQRIADQWQDGWTAIVTHGGCIRALLIELLGQPPESLGSIPCEFGSFRELHCRRSGGSPPWLAAPEAGRH
jgi:broad specificity phosphatase PhoE